MKEAVTQPAQESVAWLTESRYAEIHTSKWTPKIQQVFSKDGLLESQTIQYTPQSVPTPYPSKCHWVSLTEEEKDSLLLPFGCYWVIGAIEAMLKEKNGV